ncbi:MAG: ATP-binding protein [Armatimonadaceae bacterium]
MKPVPSVLYRLIPRTLFLQLLFSFLLATFLGASLFNVVNRLMGDEPLLFRHFVNHSGITTLVAQEIGEHNATGDKVKAAQLLQQMEASTGLRLSLLDRAARPVLGQPPTAEAIRVARMALASPSGSVSSYVPKMISIYPIQVRSGERFVLIGQMPGGLLANLAIPALRTVLLLVVVAIFCYLLAGAIAAPVKSVQRAARQLAAGNLRVRVGEEPALRGRQDEIAEIGRDFDSMAEKLEQAISAQQRLIADISHELRSPLARLSVALELTRQSGSLDNSSASTLAGLARIEREAARMNSLIGELLTLSRMEVARTPVEPVRVDLANRFASIVADADFEARSRRCQVLLTHAEPVLISGNEELLHRAVENVVRNAVRYTAEETSVEVSLHRVENGRGTFAEIVVRDHGPGVPPDALPHLFTPFYRVEEDRSRDSGGSGLGLAIAQRAIGLHHGSLHATNATGGGLEVRICLPETVPPMLNFPLPAGTEEH